MLELSDILEQEYFKFSVNPVTQTNNLKSAIEKYTGVKVNIFKNCKVSEILRQLSKKFSKKKLSKSKFLNSEKVWLCRTQIEVIHILDVNVCLWRRCQGFLVTLLLHLLTMFLSSTCSNRRLSLPPGSLLLLLLPLLPLLLLLLVAMTVRAAWSKKCTPTALSATPPGPRPGCPRLLSPSLQDPCLHYLLLNSLL